MRKLVWATIVLMAGCMQREGTAPVVAPDEDAGAGAGEGTGTPKLVVDGGADTKAAPVPDGTLSCPALGDAAVAQQAYTRGVTELEAAREGEHYRVEPFDEGMQELRVAAEQGHRAAQSLYGRRLFESMFLVEAPMPEQREAYVVALAQIRIAGRRGDPEAQGYLPGLLEQPSLREPPFDQIPADWIREAIARADAWISCHGEAAGDRGASR